MPSLEFDLIRETARTNWKEPELPWGGIPNITTQDVQTAYSMISHPVGAFALKAKFAGNQMAVNHLVEWMREVSWDLWAEYPHLQETRITRDTLCRTGELVVLYFLYPEVVGVTVERSISYCKTSKTAWNNYLKYHRTTLWDNITRIEGNAVRQVYACLHGVSD